MASPTTIRLLFGLIGRLQYPGVFKLTVERLVSLVVLSIYLAIAFRQGGAASALGAVPYTLLPLACIWFAEQLTDYRGWGNLHLVTDFSPAVLIRIGGWILLLLPFWAPILGGCLGIQTAAGGTGTQL